jgi:hypothetical protein
MKDVTYRKLKDYVLFKCTAKYEKELYKSYILFVKKVLDDKKMGTAIIDLRDTKSDVPTFDKFELAEFMVKTWGNKYCLGIWNVKSMINKFFETVAVNRGATVFVSDDINEIKKWLKSL